MYTFCLGWGRIVNTSSQMGLISTPGKAPYSAVKAALIGLAKVTVLLKYDVRLARNMTRLS